MQYRFENIPALKLCSAVLLALLPAVPGSCYAQDSMNAAPVVPVLQTRVIRPSNAPSIPAQSPFLTQIKVQPNLGPVNTGPGIVYTCNANIDAATCNYLNTTVAGYYNATFTNANANIYIQYGSTGLGQSVQYFNYVTYNQYVTALNGNPNKSAIQTSAQSALSTYDAPHYGSNYVEVTSALGTSLGFAGMTGIQTNMSACAIGSANCYNAIITITNDPGITLYYDNLGGTEPAGAYDFYAVAEHETDEVLGTSSCISTQSTSLSNACDGSAPAGSGTPSAVDLFRYSSAGSLVLNSSLSTNPGAYFSYDGGSTNGAKGVGGSPKFYNTLSNGDDYADYVASSPNCATNQAIQDGTGCPGADAAITILNDGNSEINILTAIGYRVPAGGSACTNPNPNPNPNPASFANPGDFNGDCKSDLLWRNTSTGQVYEWMMNGTTFSSTGSPGNPTADWVIQGAGDFNGDGMADLLWRNSTTGQVYVWQMNGSALVSSGSLGYVSADWSIAGIGDFNGDGKADILWWNGTTGQVYLWLMNGTAMNGGGSISYVSGGWSIKGIGDFNGDGKADILWRNSTTGQVYIWLMNGTTISSQGTPGSPTADWVIQGVGDFDKDGKSDLLWRNSMTGQVYLWLMNGTALASGPSVSYVSTDWVIQDIGDYDGDGKADILWRNGTTGQVYIWLMNGAAISSQGSPATPTSSWQIQTVAP